MMMDDRWVDDGLMRQYHGRYGLDNAILMYQVDDAGVIVLRELSAWPAGLVVMHLTIKTSSLRAGGADMVVDVCFEGEHGMTALRRLGAAPFDAGAIDEFEVCVDMSVDMRVDMRVYMRIDMRIDMRVDMHVDMCVDMYVDMCVDVRVDMCVRDSYVRSRNLIGSSRQSTYFFIVYVRHVGYM